MHHTSCANAYSRPTSVHHHRRRYRRTDISYHRRRTRPHNLHLSPRTYIYILPDTHYISHGPSSPPSFLPKRSTHNHLPTTTMRTHTHPASQMSRAAFEELLLHTPQSSASPISTWEEYCDVPSPPSSRTRRKKKRRKWVEFVKDRCEGSGDGWRYALSAVARVGGAWGCCMFMYTPYTNKRV